MKLKVRLHRLVVMLLVLASLAAICLVAVLVYPAPATGAPRTLGLDVLADRARAEAGRMGLALDSSAQTAIPMTLRDWLALRNADLGEDADQFGLSGETPVYVVAMRGNPTRAASTVYASSDTAWPARDNVTMVLDARNGDLLWVGVASPGFAVTAAGP